MLSITNFTYALRLQKLSKKRGPNKECLYLGRQWLCMDHICSYFPVEGVNSWSLPEIFQVFLHLSSLSYHTVPLSFLLLYLLLLYSFHYPFPQAYLSHSLSAQVSSILLCSCLAPLLLQFIHKLATWVWAKIETEVARLTAHFRCHCESVIWIYHD